jgi:phage tail-like protein
LLGSVAGAQTSASTARNVPQKAATTKTQGDFSLSNRISVGIDGVSVAGVHSSMDFNALRADPMREQTRPGNHKPDKFTLTKDWSNTMEWYEWRKKVMDGKTDRRSVSIIFHDDAGAEVGRMNFYNCWPVKHTMPSADAKNSGHAMETIELAYEWFEWKGK